MIHTKRMNPGCFVGASLNNLCDLGLFCVTCAFGGARAWISITLTLFSWLKLLTLNTNRRTCGAGGLWWMLACSMNREHRFSTILYVCQPLGLSLPIIYGSNHFQIEKYYLLCSLDLTSSTQAVTIRMATYLASTWLSRTVILETNEQTQSITPTWKTTCSTEVNWINTCP